MICVTDHAWVHVTIITHVHVRVCTLVSFLVRSRMIRGKSGDESEKFVPTHTSFSYGESYCTAKRKRKWLHNKHWGKQKINATISWPFEWTVNDMYCTRTHFVLESKGFHGGIACHSDQITIPQFKGERSVLPVLVHTACPGFQDPDVPRLLTKAVKWSLCYPHKEDGVGTTHFNLEQEQNYGNLQ